MSRTNAQSPTDMQPHISSIKGLLFGFALSLALTLLAFTAVHYAWLTGYALIATLLILASIQTTVQLWFFLHFGKEDKPRWNTIFLFNFIGIILLIVIASIWVMNSLHYRMMTPDQQHHHMQEQSQKGF